MSRADLAAAVADLRARDYRTSEIAAELHASASYVRELTTDPDGSRRRARTAGTCTHPGCNASTHGRGSVGPPPTLCREHYNASRRPPHGTASRYHAGCHCTACRAANAEQSRAYRQKAVAS